MAGEQSDLSLAKDWIYVLFTPLTLIFGVLTLFCWDRRNRTHDKKEADAEKIVNLLSKDYDEVVEKYSHLKKRFDDLKENKIDTESKTFTEFDVLRYMCDDKNWDKFNRTHYISTNQPFPSQLFHSQPFPSQPFPSQPFPSPPYAPIQTSDHTSDHTSDGRKDIMSHVNKIMKFFKNFAFKLSALDKRCPDDIKDEFSGEIAEMGATIRPFVTENRQKLIDKVLKYFGYPGEGDGQSPPQPRSGQGSDQAPSQQRQQSPPQPRPDQGSDQALSQQRQQGENQPPFSSIQVAPPQRDGQAPPQVQAINDAIPYIEHFVYENDKMKCSIFCTRSSIKTLASWVETKKIMLEGIQERIISAIIRKLWPDLSGDLLHLLRMVMFMLKDDPNTDVSALDERVQSIVNLNDSGVVKRLYRNVLDDIDQAQNIRKDHQEFNALAKTALTSLRYQLDRFLNEVEKFNNS